MIKEHEMIKEKGIIEECMRKCFELDDNTAINFDRELDDYGVNSISFIKMLVLLETELNIEFDEATFNFADYKTPNQILEYISSL